MSEYGDDCKDMRREQQERRAKRLPVRTQQIQELGEHGYEVTKVTDYQYRINKVVDLYPTHRRYHVLKNGKRGTYPLNNLAEFLKDKLKISL